MTFVQKVPNERIEVTYRDQGDRAYALMSLIRPTVHPDVENFSALYRIQPVLFLLVFILFGCASWQKNYGRLKIIPESWNKVTIQDLINKLDDHNIYYSDHYDGFNVRSPLGITDGLEVIKKKTTARLCRVIKNHCRNQGD
jgi:hypothetical protein